jgi:5-methylcytosine-specific restriction endonuclease McrBC GTP-binding regulatory subunit McrB
MKNSHPLNIIYHGPPGTGKTWRACKLAMEIVSGKKHEKHEKLGEYIYEGRVGMMTFHASMGYEDFIEGIRPFTSDEKQVLYEVEDGIFKQLCTRATYSLYRTWQKRLAARKPDFDKLYKEFIDFLSRMMADEEAKEYVFETATGKMVMLERIGRNYSLVFRYLKGSRSYAVSKRRLEKLYNEFAGIESINQVVQDIKQAIGKGNEPLYWAVFNRLKEFEQNVNLAKQLSGDVENEPPYEDMKVLIADFDFQKLTTGDYEKADKFVMVIDEINRGNVAAIMGELITIIEENRRAGMPQALSTRLPHSKESFTVPPNLHIIATMNTANQNITQIDHALRRRFLFRKLAPDASLLKPVAGIDLPRLLRTINGRISSLIDEDHQVGHAYLMPVLQATAPVKKLHEIFYEQIVPLLGSFFMNDYYSMGKVLGNEFISHSPESISFAKGFSAEEEQAPYFVSSQKGVVQYLERAAFKKALKSVYEQ